MKTNKINRLQLLLLLLTAGVVYPLQAQDLAGYQKLRGVILSTAADDDYTRHQYNAFDTNKETSFMARDVNGWVGLDLGEVCPILKFRIFPMPDRNEQFVGTKFQGADNPEFNNPVTMFTVTTAPNAGQYTIYDVQGRHQFRYVRCMNPDHRCSIAELEFYTGENQQSVNYQQLTNLPTIYIETQGCFDFVTKEHYVPSKVAVSNGASIEVYDADVRGRGNSTWMFMEKKAFRIKFNSKQHFLGLPANAKSWTLIACAVDKTFLRNGLAFEMSRFLDFEFTPGCVFVDVVLDGFYYGTYMASDHINVDKNRINIEEMVATDVSPTTITGGYHLELDAYANEEPVHFYTNRGMPFSIKSPEEEVIVLAQYEWIKNHINQLENALFTDPDYACERYIDIESAVKYYLHSELTGNCDAYWCIPCFKRRGDDKLYFGPVWDFDQAFLTNERVPRYVATLDTWHGTAQPWFRRIMQTEAAQKELLKLWKKVKAGDLKQKLLDYADTNAALLQQSQALNYQRWNSLSRKVWFEDALFGTYNEYIDFVKQFIVDRFAWFDGYYQGEKKAILPPSTPGNPLKTWKYTLSTPAANWYKTSFNDSGWQSGQAPFGTERDLQNTLWTTDQIYIRTQFYVEKEDFDRMEQSFFYLFHDEDCWIYLNDQLAFYVGEYNTDYQTFEFNKSFLKEGWNTIAIKCIQTAGGQLIDVGIFAALRELDSDGDGVPDDLDLCPDTPTGVVVDEFGCPLDADGDGVPDYLDECPNTPTGVMVDAVGCPVDSDGDGVPDYLDECPNTPAGVVVDAVGCPLDSDGDGVPDYLDECPNTPAGVVVDAVGCPLDSDGDGVPDYLDECPDTPIGVEVNEVGCPLTSVNLIDGMGKYKHFVRDGILFIHPIENESLVKLYSIDGRLLRQETAESGKVQMTLPHRGVYFISFSGETIKVCY